MLFWSTTTNVLYPVRQYTSGGVGCRCHRGKVSETLVETPMEPPTQEQYNSRESEGTR